MTLRALPLLLALAAFPVAALPAADPPSVFAATMTVNDDTPLEDVAALLERSFPNTRVLVEARPGSSRHPVIPRFALRGATLSEALKMITALVPAVQSTTETIGGTTVVKLRTASDELTRTMILPLGAAVDRVVGKGDAAQRKRALDSILSMVRAVSDQSRSAFGPAQLKVHEETELLIANGSDDQLKVISDALGHASAGKAPQP